jgi:hypothetical protein
MTMTIQDDVLGTLTYDVRWSKFDGVVPFGDKQVEISVIFGSPPKVVSDTDVLQARSAYSALVDQKASIEAGIVREYLSLYNDEWRPEESDPINQDQFLDAIEPEHIDIELGHVRGLWYDDGNLFAGHALHVRFTDDGNISEIALAG